MALYGARSLGRLGPRNQLIDDVPPPATRHAASAMDGLRRSFAPTPAPGLLTYRAPRLGAPTPEGCHQTRPMAPKHREDPPIGARVESARDQRGRRGRRGRRHGGAPPTPDRWLAFPVLRSPLACPTTSP